MKSDSGSCRRGGTATSRERCGTRGKVGDQLQAYASPAENARTGRRVGAALIYRDSTEAAPPHHRHEGFDTRSVWALEVFRCPNPAKKLSNRPIPWPSPVAFPGQIPAWEAGLRPVGGLDWRQCRQAGGHWFEPSTAHSRKAPLMRGFFAPNGQCRRREWRRSSAQTPPTAGHSAGRSRGRFGSDFASEAGWRPVRRLDWRRCRRLGVTGSSQYRPAGPSRSARRACMAAAS
jgi:hypothetical protein